MGRKGGNRLPDGWQGCPPTGSGFVDDRFFVFKTPLNSVLNSKLPHRERFSIDNTLHKCSQMNNSRIGLWIDLTNTSRYYCPEEIRRRGIHYEKLACEGHGRSPSHQAISRFCNLVNEFFRRNRYDYVGVHCTHGFNRTGFLICSYLIRYRNYSAAEAVQEFARHRSPGIYRQIYVNELYQMTQPILPPPQVMEPVWLHGNSTSSSDRRSRRRHGSATSIRLNCGELSNSVEEASGSQNVPSVLPVEPEERIHPEPHAISGIA